MKTQGASDAMQMAHYKLTIIIIIIIIYLLLQTIDKWIMFLNQKTKELAVKSMPQTPTQKPDMHSSLAINSKVQYAFWEKLTTKTSLRNKEFSFPGSAIKERWLHLFLNPKE